MHSPPSLQYALQRQRSIPHGFCEDHALAPRRTSLPASVHGEHISGSPSGQRGSRQASLGVLSVVELLLVSMLSFLLGFPLTATSMDVPEMAPKSRLILKHHTTFTTVVASYDRANSSILFV